MRAQETYYGPLSKSNNIQQLQERNPVTYLTRLIGRLSERLFRILSLPVLVVTFDW